MQPFAFENSDYPIRSDLIAAYRSYWVQLAQPGTWWTGAERVAIAAEVRQASQCNFCAERKTALSPYSFPGEHSSVAGTVLDSDAVDAVHRIITDQTRITKTWIDQIAERGLSAEKYVELVGVTVCVFSIDEFNRALGIPLEPLPAPIDGEPSNYRPGGLETETARVPLIACSELGENEADLWPKGHSANVVRALSLVPNAVREWLDLGSAQYLPMKKVANFGAATGRLLNRMQIEIVAGRVSSHNECFY